MYSNGPPLYACATLQEREPHENLSLDTAPLSTSTHVVRPVHDTVSHRLVNDFIKKLVRGGIEHG